MDDHDKNLEAIIHYISRLLEKMPPDERKWRLEELGKNPTIDSFYPRTEYGYFPREAENAQSTASIHYGGLKSHFDLMEEKDKQRLANWAAEKLGDEIRISEEREETERKTASIPYVPAHRQGRRIIVFLDGTGNTPEELRHTATHDLMNPPPITNVVRLLRGVQTDDDDTECPQVIGYFKGVATEGSASTRFIDGISGRGLSRTVLDAYRFISHNLEWVGVDSAKVYRDEIYIFGFSRGAFAARALNGFLNRLGLIRKHGLWLLPFFFDQYKKILSSGEDFDVRTESLWRKFVHPEYHSIPVKFLGVWDTVGALGIPVKGLSWMTANYESFHDTGLTPNVTHAYQALAIHELRQPFKPVFWTKKAVRSQMVEQVWFPGAHSNIGGGYERTGLSSYALDWMAYKAQMAGLELDMPYFNDELMRRKFDQPIALSRNFGHGEPGLLKRRKKYWGILERPLNLASIDTYLNQHFPGQKMEDEIFRQMKAHWSVEDRLKTHPQYGSDSESLERLDILSANLPVVNRREKLVP